MTVHAIQGYVAPDSGMTESDIQTEVDDWVSKRQKWSSDWDATVTRQNTEIDGTGDDFIRFAVRFEWSEAKDDTMQKLVDKFKNKVDWFVGLYHVCYHDEDPPSACEWNERWEWMGKDVTIPTSVEDAIPDANETVNT